MEDYRVTQTGDEIQKIFNQSPVDSADIAELKEATTSLDGRLEAVEGKIPSGASSENPLTDKQYVDSSIASASATFRGTYNEVADLELTTEATHAEIGEALASVIDTADSNDYCFVQIPTADATPTEIESIERYKFVTGTGWQYEYTLNNSGFTADQWAAINSGITGGLVAKLTDLPTNADLNTLLNGKANASDVYTKSETYTKTELDTQLGAKANSADVYEKSQTYTKQEVDALITTPEVQYVTVTATSGTTSVTDVLPATGAANTIYRVGSWDGTQYDDGVYSEYSWNGSAYILLDVKNYGLATGSDFNNPTSAQRSLVTTVGSVLDGMPEGVFDVSARNSGSTWASLSALLSDADLDTLIPASWRKGGMSIRFVCSSDNKYIQARCMAQNFTTDVTQWQGVDDVPEAGSDNLVKSGGVNKKITQHNWELHFTPTSTNQRILELDGLPAGSKIYRYPIIDNSYIETFRYYYTLNGANAYRNIQPSETIVIGANGETPNYFAAVNGGNSIHLLVNQVNRDTRNNSFEYGSISGKNLVGHNQVFNTVNLTPSTTEGTDIFDSVIPKIPIGSVYHIDFADSFSSWLNKYRVYLNGSETYTEYSVQNLTLTASQDITAIRVRIIAADIISGQTPPSIDVEMWWEDIALQLSDIKGKADLVPELSEGLVQLNGEIDELDTINYHLDNLQKSDIYGAYVNAQGTYVSRSQGVVIYPIKGGEKFIIKGHSSRDSYAGLLDSIDNISAGNSADFMDGESVTTIPANKNVVLSAKSDGYIFVDLFNGSYPSAPQTIERYIPTVQNVCEENIVVRKLVCAAKATTSTSTYVDLINSANEYDSGNLDEKISQGTKMIITVTGLSPTTTQKLVFRFNNATSDSDFATKNGTFVMVAASDITKIRVIARNANVVSPSEVTVKIEIDDLGASLKELESKAVNILDVSKQSFIDANVDGYDSVNDKFTEGTYSVIIANSSNKTALSDVIANYVAKYTSSGDAYPYIQLNYNYSDPNYWWKYPIGGKGFYKFGQCKCIFAGTQTLNSPWTDDIKMIITVPAGCELYIKNINAEYADGFVNKNAFKVFQHGTERRTVGADNKTNWDLWTHIGNYGAIVIPKRTTDGKWVCYHDDSFGSNPLVQVIGNPSAPLPAASMQACTFAETQTLEYKSTNFYGDHDTIPTLEEFFAKCAQMGVHPALSCHPTHISEADDSTWKYADWAEVKALAKKYRVLNKLTIKCSFGTDTEGGIIKASQEIRNFFSVFGNDIESFIADIDSNPTLDEITALANVGWDLDKVKVGFEIVVTTAYFSDATIALFDDNNLIHGIAPGGSGDFYENAKNLKDIIDKGCYEITADQFYSNGLNWA